MHCKAISLVELIHILTTVYYKFGTVCKLAYGCLQICSILTKLPTELVFLKEIFLKNGYPENFINKCFKRFMDNMHVVKETNLIVEKKRHVLLFSYLGSISLKTRSYFW